MNRQVVALVLSSALSAHVHAQIQIDKPGLAVGDRWVLKTSSLFDNSETQSDEYRVTNLNGEEVELTQTTLSSKTANNVGKSATTKASAANWTFAKIVEGKYVAIAFPLDAGKTWEYEYKYVPNDGEPLGTYSYTAKAEKWEDVQVPAGTFKALKIIHEGRWTRLAYGRTLAGTSLLTLWYAPEAKWFVKRELLIRRSNGSSEVNIRLELVSLDLAKQ